MDELRSTLRVPVAGLYNFKRSGQVLGPGLAAFSLMSPDTARAHVGELLAARHLTYDPAFVAPRDRNRVETLDELVVTRRAPADTGQKLGQLTRRRTGVVLREQIRVLIAEGPTLLGWVGALADDPAAFGARERAILRRLVPLLARRLRVEERLAQAPLESATLAVALEAMSEPVFVVDAAGDPVLMNVAARALWASARVEVTDDIDDALAGARARFEVNSIVGPGLPQHWLLVRRASHTEATARAAQASRHWGLTARQLQVLRLVAEGLTNASIAREINCAERTVELHVTHLLTKARAPNRASLVARYWTGTP